MRSGSPGKIDSKTLSDSLMSLDELKRMARDLLPSSSMLRNLILNEPDLLPRSNLVPKVEVFARLLYEEI